MERLQATAIAARQQWVKLLYDRNVFKTFIAMRHIVTETFSDQSSSCAISPTKCRRTITMDKTPPAVSQYECNFVNIGLDIRLSTQCTMTGD